MKILSTNEACELHARLIVIERSLLMACKPIIEAYGWSSKSGRKAEKISLGAGIFYRNYFRLEDYIGHAVVLQEREFRISTEGGLSHKLSTETHFLISCILRYARNDLQTMGIDVSNKIGKTKPLVKSIFKLVSFLDTLRSNLDDEYIREHGAGSFPKDISPYYPRDINGRETP